MFILPPPPDFQPFDPAKPVHIYRRHLPHWRQEGASYFVTFRLGDSIPQENLRALRDLRTIWERDHPEPRSEEQWRLLAKAITSKTEAWLDEGYGECMFREAEAARIMSDAMLHFQGSRCVSFCFAVLPNHIHWLVKPLASFSLERLLSSVKGYVGKEVSRRLGRSGEFWHEESYDRIIRDEEHLWRVVQYIGRNPAKAGLPKALWNRWILPEWELAGWRFEV